MSNLDNAKIPEILDTSSRGLSEADLAVPDLQFIVPAANENRWSDLLASLISTDPGPIAQFVGAEPDEVKVLSDLGSRPTATCALSRSLS